VSDSALTTMVADARRLLNYAVSRGLVSSASMIKAIVDIEDTLAKQGSPTPTDVEAFLSQYSALSKLTEGVSAESLSNDVITDEKNTRRLYITTLTIILILLVPITTITVVGNQLIQDSLSDIYWICSNESKVFQCTTQNTAPIQPEASLPKTASAQNQGVSSQGTGSSDAGFQHPYETSLKTVEIWKRFRILTMMCFTSPNDIDSVWTKNARNLKAHFEEIRFKGDLTMIAFKLVYVTVAGCLLPILFAVLGAVTFGLRELRQRLETRTWLKRGLAIPVLRIVTAGLAGFMISIFTDFTAKSGLSPIAVAFVIGYSVDVFFSFLDAIVARLRS
jgi:hypothetical protein